MSGIQLSDAEIAIIESLRAHDGDKDVAEALFEAFLSVPETSGAYKNLEHALRTLVQDAWSLSVAKGKLVVHGPNDSLAANVLELDKPEAEPVTTDSPQTAK